MSTWAVIDLSRATIYHATIDNGHNDEFLKNCAEIF